MHHGVCRGRWRMINPVLRPHGDTICDMTSLRLIFTAASVAAFFLPLYAAEPADRQFETISHLPENEIQARAGEIIEVAVDLGSTALSVEPEGERVVMRYRMAFNQIAEGWSWQPGANPAVDDYYRYKFLPLQSVSVERGEYAHEDKIGEAQNMKIRWRYDYFLAFENLYDFYPRTLDDDAGFVADLPAGPAWSVGMLAELRLEAPVLSESTTFWKATYGKPTDFTLKKRYLIGRLLSVSFIDTSNGQLICRIKPGSGGRCSESGKP